MFTMLYSHWQEHSSFLTSCSLWPVAFLCSYWRQHWASTPVREESCAGGRSAHCLKVTYTCQDCNGQSRVWQVKKAILKFYVFNNTAMLIFHVVCRHGICKPNYHFLWINQLHCDFSLGFPLLFCFFFWRAAMGHL